MTLHAAARPKRQSEAREPRAPSKGKESLWLRGLDKEGVPRVYELRVPVEDLVSQLPLTSRHNYSTRVTNIIGAIVGGFVLAALSSAGLLFGLPVIFVAFVSSFAAMCGCGIGWFVGRTFRPKPYWMASYEWEGDQRTIYPYEHSQIGRGSVELVYPNKELDPDGEAQVKGVWRATTWYETEQMRDEKEDLRGGIDTWQKVEAGALVVIALGLMVFLFFFFAAFNEGGDTPPVESSFGRAELVE